MPPNLARGTWKLIADGIEAYLRERGCKPVALVLHPRHAKTLRREMPDDTTLRDDVSVLISPRFALPVLVDQNGNPSEL